MLHHMLFSRLLAAASAVVLTVLSFLAPPQRIPDDDTVVRVGLCYGETGKSSITMHAAGGFTLGRAGADGWTALLAVENETVIVSRLQSALCERRAGNRSSRTGGRYGIVRKWYLYGSKRLVPRRFGGNFHRLG